MKQAYAFAQLLRTNEFISAVVLCGSGLAGTVALFRKSLITGMFKLVKSANGGKHLFDVTW